jgi:hypothetical protein
VRPADLQKNTALVIGSTRNIKSDESLFIHTIWQEDKASLSYQDKKEIITIDINDAVTSPERHIKGDAAVVTLPNCMKIDTLYFERPITLNTSALKENPLQAITTNVIASYIANLLPQIADNGKVIIEWHPFLVRLKIHTGNEDSFIKDKTALSWQENNPFTGYFDTQLCLVATCLAINKGISQSYSKSFIEEAQKLVPTIKGCITFYKSYFAHNTINKVLTLETEMVKLISERDDTQSIQIAVHPRDNICKFITQVNHIGLVDINGTITYKKLIDKNKSLVTAHSYVTISKNEILLATVYSFLWRDIAVNLNKSQALAHMQKLGLKDCTLTRGTSPLNNRTNVWLLSGTKKAIPEKEISENSL